MTNTHNYDGKLGDMIALVKDEIDRVHNIDKQQKMEKLLLMKSLLCKSLLGKGTQRGKDTKQEGSNEARSETELSKKSEKQRETLKFFDLICNSIGNASNYDPSNKLYADDILYLCCELWDEIKDSEKGQDLLKTLASQLYDMRTGSCPPGRSTRLFQVYIAFKGI